jgi:hypothetical protein
MKFASSVFAAMEWQRVLNSVMMEILFLVMGATLFVKFNNIISVLTLLLQVFAHMTKDSTSK